MTECRALFHALITVTSDLADVVARVNNLLDEDFTSFQTSFTDPEGDGTYSASFLDDFNNKDKARNLWLSVNMNF
jgi:outer membrane receptor for ferrienterochelin and colicins